MLIRIEIRMTTQNNNKPVVTLAINRDGEYDWQAQADIHAWMRQHAIPHFYHHTIISGKRVLSVEFDNENDAIMFKLTWAEYVHQ